ncbi:hypothetical protein F4779DRAFT_147184 [Xylariaceae sp. FL0662B]|nr:hypothetical protein F4779DRAFT_147184 [Xylariaceae sp. FL0662B]
MLVNYVAAASAAVLLGKGQAPLVLSRLAISTYLGRYLCIPNLLGGSFRLVRSWSTCMYVQMYLQKHLHPCILLIAISVIPSERFLRLRSRTKQVPVMTRILPKASSSSRLPKNLGSFIYLLITAAQLITVLSYKVERIVSDILLEAPWGRQTHVSVDRRGQSRGTRGRRRLTWLALAAAPRQSAIGVYCPSPLIQRFVTMRFYAMNRTSVWPQTRDTFFFYNSPYIHR